MKLEFKTLKKCSGIIMCAECPFEIHKHKFKVRSGQSGGNFFFFLQPYTAAEETSCQRIAGFNHGWGGASK